MKLKFVSMFTYICFFHTLHAQDGVRVVSATSCDIIKVKLALGITTQVVFEQKPQTTLFADQTHFKINSSKQASRSLAIIPVISSHEIDVFRINETLPEPKRLSELLNKAFKTNLFVFFENKNQLMFEMNFVVKEEADYILKVKQIFSKGCVL